MLGCQNLASHILDFVQLATALRLGATSRDIHSLVDPAITKVTVRGHALPPDPIAFGARFPLLRSLTLEIYIGQSPTHEPTITFLRRLALETPLPTHITRLVICGAHRGRREQTSNVLDALLLVDWPRLTHLETKDLAHVLARAQVQPALATMLARLTLLGNVGNPTWYGSDYNGTYSRADTTALAMALQNGVLPNPPPAISHVTYLAPSGAIPQRRRAPWPWAPSSPPYPQSPNCPSTSVAMRFSISTQSYRHCPPTSPRSSTYSAYMPLPSRSSY